MRHPISKQGWSSRSIKELEYSLTLRTLDTNAANIVAISRYQYVRLLPARVISAYAAPTLFAIFFYHVFTALQRSSTLKINLSLLLKSQVKSQQFFMQFSILFSFVVSSGPGQVMFSYLFSTAYISMFLSLLYVCAICRRVVVVFVALQRWKFP